MIPKIIHQTSPRDKNKWHPLWKKCHASWKKHFPEPEYQHVMWNDEDLNNLIQQYFSKYFELYNSFPYHIIKIDFARFCILYQYGGIYADMDMYCYQNFYDELKKDAFVVEGCIPQEKVQNSLMGSTPKNKFFESCIDLSNLNHPYINTDDYIKHCCGPYHVSDVFKLHSEKVQLLPRETYNNYHTTYQKNYKTKHMLTGMWGEENFSRLQTEYSNLNQNISYEEFIKQKYNEYRKINLNNFKFNIDYSKKFTYH
jgi:mannosyltransferase OCH1-like enzyme